MKHGILWATKYHAPDYQKLKVLQKSTKY